MADVARGVPDLDVIEERFVFEAESAQFNLADGGVGEIGENRKEEDRRDGKPRRSCLI